MALANQPIPGFDYSQGTPNQLQLNQAAGMKAGGTPGGYAMYNPAFGGGRDPRYSQALWGPNALGGNGQPIGGATGAGGTAPGANGFWGAGVPLNQVANGGAVQRTSTPYGNGSTGNMQTPNANPITSGYNTSNSSVGQTNGVPGYGGNFDFSNWKDPGYDWRLQQGNQLLQGSAAAGGNLLSGSTLKDLTNYGQGAASQEYQNAFNRFQGNKAFNYGVDTGDRNFNYMTQLGDQNYNLGLAQTLAGIGQYGTTGGANTNNLLATLLSQNTIGAGNAAAAGTIGGGNAISGGISQAISNMLGQNFMNQYMPQGK